MPLASLAGIYNLIFMKLNIDAYVRLARLDKPTGIWLLLIPCWLGLGLAHTEKYWLYAVFAVGAIVMRTAGCIINDIFDRKLDAQVERTKNRPLASGGISVSSALIFLAILLFLGLGILLTLPSISIYICLLIMPIVVLYPLAKRFTDYPQVILGVAFNIGVLVAYAAATGTLSFAAFILYIGCVFWTLGYDTIYALQDRDDDLQAGIKSTAIKFGQHNRKFVGLFYWVFVGCYLIAILLTKHQDIISIVFLILAKLHFSWQVYKLNQNNRVLCGQLFKSNVYVGLLLVAAMIF
jgi:4-hydroxybenzoate polyprenyltransferase